MQKRSKQQEPIPVFNAEKVQSNTATNNLVDEYDRGEPGNHEFFYN